MRPEVLAALEYLASPCPDMSDETNAADAARVAIVRQALESAELAILGLIRALAVQTEYPGINIDMPYHSQADREHVHIVG